MEKIDVRKLIDGKEHTLNESSPMTDYSNDSGKSDPSSYYRLDITEILSYCVEVTLFHEKKVILAQLYTRYCNGVEECCSWSEKNSGKSYKINGNDIWKYTEESLDIEF